jgi:MFS family permease
MHTKISVDAKNNMTPNTHETIPQQGSDDERPKASPSRRHQGAEKSRKQSGEKTESSAMPVSSTPMEPLQLEEATIEPDPEDNFPEGGLRAWLVVASAFLTLFPSFGFMVSIGTLQDYWSRHQLQAYTSRDVGWVASVFVYLSLALGIWVGPIFDRYGPRWIALSGSVGYVVTMFLLAECKLYYQFMLCCGILGGTTGALLTTTSLAVVAHWFKERRGLAQGIAMCGSSFAGLTIPMILRTTLPKYGYAWSIRILAFLFLGCLILGNALMKARIPPSAAMKSKAIITPSMFLDLRFSLLTISIFGLEIVLFGALGIFPTYATSIPAYPADAGFYLISIMNGVSCIGRLVPGYVSDKIGRFNTLWIAIVFTLASMLILWLPFGDKSLTILYIFSAFFGFGTGSWMALVPACIGQLCRAEEFGRYYGTLYFVASLSTLVCIPIGGELIQVVGPRFLVGFYCVVLAFALFTFTLSRWACLGWKWSWTAKI